MQIEIKLFATLREGRGKSVRVELGEGATVASAVEAAGIRRKDIAILLVNGRDGKYDLPLVPDDYLSLFPPVGGG